MRSIEEITKQINEISLFVSKPYPNEPIVLQERLISLTNYLQLSGELKADSQYYYDIEYAKQTEYLISNNPNLTPSLITNLAKAKTATYTRLLLLADRLNSSITHQIDSIRKLISYLKSEIFNQN